MSAPRSLILSLFACLFVGGCPGTLEDPDRFRECTPESVETDLFRKTCGNSLCHDNQNPEADLDLLSAGVASRLVGVPSTDANCSSTKLLIDPQNPAQSFLIEKITQSKPTCGARMPLSSKLTDAQIECVKQWVTNVTGGGGSGGSSGTDAGSSGAAGASGSSGAATDAGSE